MLSTKKPQNTLKKTEGIQMLHNRKLLFDKKQRETQSHNFVNVEKASWDAKKLDLYFLKEKKKREKITKIEGVNICILIMLNKVK